MKRLVRVCFAFASLGIAACLLQAQNTPPAAAVREVTETLFGQTVTDPYRWMENEKDPELASFLKAQNDYTRRVLDSISGREKLYQRLMQLDQAGTQVSGVQHWVGKYFYYKLEATAQNRKLYVRDGVKGAERVLVDPEKIGEKNVHYSIDFFTPSFDGKYVVYGISQGGSEQSVMHVVEVSTGQVLPDSIDRCLYGYGYWLPDNRSFFYMRQNKLAPETPAADRLKKMRAYIHKLGNDPDKDPPVLGFGVSSDVDFAESDFPVVGYSPAAPYAFGLVAHGVQNELTMYVAPISSVASSPRWKKAYDVKDEVTGFEVHGDDLFLLTHHGASRFKITKTSLSSPDPEHAAVIVPESKAVITGFSGARDGLYLKMMEGGPSYVRMTGFSGGALKAVPLPFEGAVSETFTSPLEDGVLVHATGWTTSPLWLAYDPKSGKARDTELVAKSPVDFTGVQAEEVEARSYDGTMVPLSIVHQKNLALDGSHPTLLTGYGAYGISLEPSFSPTLLAWIERGGVYAVAHVRGGGEWGEDWHRAGQKGTKMNTVRDFIACGEYLVEHKYTSPQKLAGSGTSAGGILIGRTITERPDLFAAAISRVGASNILRFENSQGGPANVPEFGTVSTEVGFKALYEMDAYSHVKPNTPYPAVLLTTGINDPRVPVWQVAKMTARLQATSTSGKPILLRVDSDAGHGFIDSTKSQVNAERADWYAFMLWQFGDPEFQPSKAGISNVAAKQ